MTTYRVQNPAMRNSMISTNYGVFRFNSEGIISGAPYGLASDLLQLEGFILIDEDGNEIQLPETDPDGTNPDTNRVTLSGGEVWTTIDGGYTIQDSNSVYTLIGSAFEINPPEVSLSSGTLVFGTGIDTTNVHALGVDSGSTIQIGTNAFIWQDIDNDLSNGYELVAVADETIPAHMLPGGGYYYQVDNGYVVGDDSMTYTIVGDLFDSDTISIDHGALVFSAGVDTASIHVIGVDSDSTLRVGDVIYKWVDTDNNIENGYELTPYIEPETPTLPDGWASIEGGYIINETYTLTGAFFPSDVTVEGTTFHFGTSIEINDLHIQGIESDTAAYVGSDTYVWKDTDNNTENGYELVFYTEPEIYHTLPSGAVWYTDNDNVIISDTSATYTLVSARSIDSDTVALDSGVLSFGSNIDTDAVHVLGVESGTTVAVGTDTYQWVEADNNDEDGLELIHYVAPPEPRRLPSGTPYDTIEGGYVISDTGVTYTLTGGAFDNGLEGVVDLQSGTFVFDSSVTTSEVHIQGIASDTTLMVGDDTYIFQNLDNNPDDMEIKPYVPPIVIHVLPGGAIYDTIEGGYSVSDTNKVYTLTGTAFDNGLDDVVDVQSGTFVFASNIDTLGVHVLGVDEDDTLYVGDNAFVWKNTDEDTTNGLEIATIDSSEEPDITLPSGWSSVEGGFAYDDGITVVTVTGVELDANNHLPVDVGDGGIIVFEEGVDISAIHAIGVYNGDILKVGDTEYQWFNADNNPYNGLEIYDLPEPQPTLPAGWATVEGGLHYSNDTMTITIYGVGLNEDNSLPVSIVDNAVNFDATVPTAGIHVTGAQENDTLMVGTDTYVFKDLDNNTENGLEITPYVAPPTVYPLRGGGSYSPVEGGYAVFDDNATYTVVGGSIDEDHIAVQSGVLVLGTGIDTSALHVLGVNPDTPIKIGGDTYIWKDLDNNPLNGLELEIVPVSGGTLPSGVTWDTVDGGYVLTNDNLSYTLTGDAFNNGVEGVVDIVNGAFQFESDVTTSDVHVIGVTDNDTLYVGSDTYIWRNTDNNADNGLEITTIPPTLPEGWSTIAGGLVYDSQITITGATANEDGSLPVVITGDTLIFDDTIDADNIHVIGVNADDTLQVGEEVYRWADLDNNLENGYEIAATIAPEPSPWTPIAGGFMYLDNNVSYTIRGSVFGTNATPENVQIIDDKLVFADNLDVSDVHVQGIQPGTTIAIGTNTYTWKDLDGDISNGYELELVTPEPSLPEGWATITEGLVYTDTNIAITLTGVDADSDPFPVSIEDNKIVFSEGVDTDAIHAFGVNMNDSAQVGNDVYIWTDKDNNPDNGYELTVITTIPADSPWSTVDGGYRYDSDTVSFTFTGSAFASGHDNIVIDGSALSFQEGLDTDNVHVLGVNADDTVKVGTDTYVFKELDNNTMNGYELEKLAEVVDTLPAGWGTITGGLTYTSDTTAVTISGITMGTDNMLPVTYENGGFIFSEGVDTDSIHAIGVNASDTVQVASTVYIWTDKDNNPDNGLEITAITSSGEDTVPGDDTIPSDNTVPSNSFTYDFDGVAFTLTGGLKEGISADDLNENARIEADGLEFGAGIISTLGGVHIQGLQSGTTVKVAGENYTLMDADGNLENGYELVGGEADAYNWKRTNRSASIYEPQIWRHYLNDSATILVIGCSARPLYENNVLTILGDDIKVVSNEAAPDFTIAGDIYGKLTNGVGFDINAGIVNGEGTDSYVVYNRVLYAPGATISGIKDDSKLEFTVKGEILSILKGAIDVASVVITGTSITSILYNGKRYYANKFSGKLVPNAWQARIAM